MSDGNLLRFHLQRKLKGESRRDAIARWVAGMIGRRKFEGASKVGMDRVPELSRRLKTEGYAELGKILDRDAIARIRARIEGNRCFDAYDRQGGTDFELEQAPPTANTAYFHWQDIVRIPELVEAVNDPALLAAAQNFLGGTPTISDVKMWWSLVGRDAKDNQLFHRDIDDFKFCKLFIYLTDVGPDDGPHVYVRGSSGGNRFHHALRFTDEEVEREFGRERLVTFCAEAGSAFLVNTYGIHKGLRPVKSRRLMFVGQYSLLPIGLIRYEPLPRPSDEYRKFDRYVNRLFLRNGV